MSISSEVYLSHPDKPYTQHIRNMFDANDIPLERSVKLYHDIAKLKSSFQYYIRHPGESVKDKNHTLLSGYIFLLNNDFETKEMLFGFLSIVSHHSRVIDLFDLREDNRYIGRYCCNSAELQFLDEVIEHAKVTGLYPPLNADVADLEQKSETYRKFLRKASFQTSFVYGDFIAFKKLFASLIYSDKFEAIFSIPKEPKRMIPENVLAEYIRRLPYHEKRDRFRKHVLESFDKERRLFRLTAPTGYGKTLTALQFALQFEKEKIIFALPFTSIIDQTYSVISDIFKDTEIDIFKIHHKTVIDEEHDEDRYSKVKFLMSSFSGEINVTTLYQIIFAMFGNSNKDNVKFNQFKNSVVIIDEAQSIPYRLRKDFIALTRKISETMNTVFIFMSATMPVVGDEFLEISDLSYFHDQNRYRLKWLNLPNGEETLKDMIAHAAQTKHTLCVVNTIQKAQELYLWFRGDFECYALNGYMTDTDKQRVIAAVAKRLEQNEEKILLISTQSIEAGVDLDFDIGFREVAPISSIIQTAGRVNRNFKKEQATLYVFEEISGYTDLIYGDLQLISKTIFSLLQERDIPESDILEVSDLYFQKLHSQLESALIDEEIKRLAFAAINQKIEEVMDGGNYKRLVIVEPYEGYVKKIEQQLLELRSSHLDKFVLKDQVEKVVKELSRFGVNVSLKDIERFTTRLNSIRTLPNMIYLPFGAPEYSKEYGVRKVGMESAENIFD
ncbi:CRISPR-associated helicase Cas3' [Nitratifractor salsuginis]|uniref:CRISPR-associated helicase, Cas3 family n=1 Tax=Nitratifractor salsuginis (strain DSM 16511 / JCM 12458 / E9I37-1) TaxID=749222 RepID=E6WXQ2_NITSE|nr:CRISPR-associated helicase Cas3' [Nitratifractor salsuginis]ADV46309.1 CRISPR-associated helicase, Cas3 family [Nitratifractor salsuginis DSM 16511]